MHRQLRKDLIANKGAVQKGSQTKDEQMTSRCKKIKKGSHRKPSATGQVGCLAVTWTGGHAGTFLDVLPLAGRASVQWGGVGAAPTPLLPAAPTHGTAGRPGGPRGPAAVDCPTRARGMEESGREKDGREGWMEGQSSQDYPTCTKEKRCVVVE